MAMINRDAFGRLVQDALSNLYDHSYLQTHPLANLFAIDSATETHGHGLHRILLEAIQQIAPPPATPFQSSVWRKHRYLILRYLEDRTATEARPGVSLQRALNIDQRVCDCSFGCAARLADQRAPH